jgi:hypothetical protein
MAILASHAAPAPVTSRLRTAALATVLSLVTLAADPAIAREPVPFAARAGLEIAQAAALSWAPDAYLVYLENDEDLDDAGAADRWGYLFFSPTLDKSRVYSVREGRILVAEDLVMKFEAPRLAPDWIDSGAAIAAADEKAGRAFREDHGGSLRTMLLMRGAFHDKDPDQTTWTLIYTAPDGPALFVVVDATEGTVRRTWRG